MKFLTEVHPVSWIAFQQATQQVFQFLAGICRNAATTHAIIQLETSVQYT